MNPPLVSVICLCYNHAPFVEEALQSVISQTHPHIQLIVVDDCSTDGSVAVIQKYTAQHPSIELIALQENLGNCRAFNRGFEKAKGDYIIDLAADDILARDRIEKGLSIFHMHGPAMGVHFSDAEMIDAGGKSLGLHSDRFPHASIAQGDIYREVLSRYFINSPTMMMRREVLEKLGGYDETLAYEDFDFWVRSSRHYEYRYSPEALVKRRILQFSLGKRQQRLGSGQLRSTFLVCEKALRLNRNAEDNQALKKRMNYEFRLAIRLLEWRLAFRYFALMKKLP